MYVSRPKGHLGFVTIFLILGKGLFFSEPKWGKWYQLAVYEPIWKIFLEHNPLDPKFMILAINALWGISEGVRIYLKWFILLSFLSIQNVTSLDSSMVEAKTRNPEVCGSIPGRCNFFFLFFFHEFIVFFKWFLLLSQVTHMKNDIFGYRCPVWYMSLIY